MNIVVKLPDKDYSVILSKIMLACYGCEIIELPKGHGDLIDRNALYERFSTLEAIALSQVEKYLGADDSDQLSLAEWRKWSVILQERSAYKFDVADAKAIIEADKAEQEAPTR